MGRREERRLRAENLRALRDQRGWSNKQLAAELSERLDEKISAEGVRTYLNPAKTPYHPRLDLMEAAAALFDVSLDYVLGRTENPSVWGQGFITSGAWWRRIQKDEDFLHRTLQDACNRYMTLDNEAARLGVRMLVRRLRFRWRQRGRDGTLAEAALAIARALNEPLEAIGLDVFRPEGDANEEYVMLMTQALRAAMRLSEVAPQAEMTQREQRLRRLEAMRAERERLMSRPDSDDLRAQLARIEAMIEAEEEHDV